MGRKSVVDQQEPGVRAHILRRLRENRLTLNELMAELQAHFPQAAAAGDLPSRSAVGRYAQGVREIVKRERDMAAAAQALVSELGEDFDSKSGALLAQAVTTLANRTALARVESGEELEIGDVLDLARAAKAAQEARSLNLRERQAVAKAAIERDRAQAKAKLETLGKTGAVAPEVLAIVIKAAYDL